MRKDIKEKIDKALLVSDGDLKAASREVLEHCIHDHEFLLGICEPFLRGIIGHAIKDVVESRSEKEGVETSASKDSAKKAVPKVLDVEALGKVTGLGANMLQTALGSRDGSHKFGTADRTRATLGRVTKASAKHVDALKAFVDSQSKQD